MKKALALAFATASLGAVASANLVINGDFELTVPNSGFGNSWTAANNDGAGGWRSTGGNPNGTYILNSNGDPNSNPTVSQLISGLTIGGTYVVSGDYATGNIGNGTDTDFGVSIDGNLWEYDVPASTTVGWSHFSESFIASSSTVTLELSGERHTDHDPRVDNISLELRAVPEPATLAVLGMGALALRRRRRA